MPRGLNDYEQALIQGRLWTPANEIGSVTAWWSIFDAETITVVSGAVSSLADKGPSNITLSQATSGTRPSYDSARKLMAPGFGQYISNASFPVVGASARIVSVVGRTPPAGTTNAMPVFWGGSGVNSQSFGLRILDVNIHKPTVSTWATDLQMVSNFEPAADTPFIMTGGYTGTAIVGNVNEGTLESLTQAINTGGGAASTILVGDGVPTTQMPCPIHEMVIWNTYDPVLWQKTAGYFAWRTDFMTGVASLVPALPAGHRFKNTPPLVGA